MTNIERDSQNNGSEEEKILKQLSKLFKNTGYLFPTTDKQVEAFESLYGSTPIEVPKDLCEPIVMISKIPEAEPFMPNHFSMAAFTHKNDEKPFPSKKNNLEDEKNK